MFRLRIVYGGRRVRQAIPSYQNRQISALAVTGVASQSSPSPLRARRKEQSVHRHVRSLRHLSKMLPTIPASLPDQVRSRPPHRRWATPQGERPTSWQTIERPTRQSCVTTVVSTPEQRNGTEREELLWPSLQPSFLQIGELPRSIFLSF